METYDAHIKSILKAQIYIQENLDGELLLKDVAKAAGFSPYHFHRIFHSFAGESLNEYIRRLRIEKAAGHLKYRKNSITDIALDSGYETPSAFTRAFGKIMGVSPKEFREQKKDLCDGQNKKKTTQERKMKDPEIKIIKDIPVLFVRKTGSYYESPKNAWEALSKFIKKHEKLSSGKRFGIALDDPSITEEANIRFDACVEELVGNLDGGEIGKQTVPGGKYAIFMHQGPYEGLSQTYDEIFSKWYPMNKDKVDAAPSFVEYLNMEKMFDKPQELLCKIYVKLKQEKFD